MTFMSALRLGKKWLVLYYVRSIFRLIQLLVKFSRSKFLLTNDTTSKIDGTGAQIQRLVSVVALSRKLKIGFNQNPFQDISVHPLDPFQDSESKKRFIEQMNYLFACESLQVSGSFQRTQYKTLSVWILLKISFRGLFIRESLEISVVEPYPVTDAFPDITNDLVELFPNWNSFADGLIEGLDEPVISIHYRQGVGGLAIYPGQRISRELLPSYFLSKLRDIPVLRDSNLVVNLFTDAPLEDMSYAPLPDQRGHWEGTPGYEGGIMKIKGNNLLSIFNENGIDVRVHMGGNPLSAIAIMSKSDFLITSRSSLSYVAGLLNTVGKVTAADGFWHPAPSSWQRD